MEISVHKLPLSIAMAAVLASSQALAAPPTTPSDFRIDVYSGTAAELFWNRSSDPDGGFVRGYAIKQDGEHIATVDALSFYTNTLTNGRSSTFTVSAIDFDNESSTSETISVVGGDQDGGTVEETARPRAPGNLSVVAYSPTAIEVFWDREDGQNFSYEVSLNGNAVTTTSGTSYFNGAVTAGRSNTIDVVAINESGVASIAATVSVNTGSDSGTEIDTDTDPVHTPEVSISEPGSLNAPANLRLDVYSTNSVELFWDRADVTGLQYEILRNDSVLSTTAGTSYFDATLVDTQNYTYTVTAIDGSGNRLSAASVSRPVSGTTAPAAPVTPTTPATPTTPVATPTTPSSTDTTPMHPETDDTPSPKNITLAIYSDSTAELNWTRPSYSNGIQTNEIFRNGELIATIPGGGNSYVDGTRTAGSGYRYEIVAINRFGRASTVFIDVGSDASAPVGTGEPVDESGLPEELAQSLDTTFNLLKVSAVEKVAATVFRFDDPAALGLRLVGTEPDEFDASVNRLEYACPLGGSWFVKQYDNEEALRDIEAVACSIGPATLTGRGSISNRLTLDGLTSERNLFFSLVTLLDSRDNSRIEIGFSNSSFNENESAGSLRVDGLSVTSPDGNYSAESFSMAVTTGEPAEIDTFGDSVIGGLTDSARIRTREPILLGDNGYPSSGALSIQQIGSSSVSYDISAGNGNPNTFTFTATELGVTTAYEISWSDTRDLGGLSLLSADPGF